MKNYITLFLCLLSCSTLALGQKKYSFHVAVDNNWIKSKIDEPVVVKLNDLQLDFNPRSAIVKEAGVEIPSQLDDLTNNGVNDELIFLIDINAKQSQKYTVELFENDLNRVYTPRVHSQMLVSDKKGNHVPVTEVTIPGTSNIYNQMHHHGPAFESELLAYRIYFDEKQTVDIYGKFNKGFEVEESGWYPNDEQLARGFGDDILRVGGSCGVGALKGWNGEEAMHISPVKTRTARVLATGPVRAIVEMEVREWDYQGSLIDMVNRYIIYGGHRDATVEVFFRKPLENKIFATGVQRIKDSDYYSDQQGLLGCWGTDWPVNDTIKYAKETVGLGVFIPQETGLNEVRDKRNYLYTIFLKEASYFKYYITFTSRKETFGYDTKEKWFDSLKTWREYIENPVTVSIIK